MAVATVCLSFRFRRFPGLIAAGVFIAWSVLSLLAVGVTWILSFLLFPVVGSLGVLDLGVLAFTATVVDLGVLIFRHSLIGVGFGVIVVFGVGFSIFGVGFGLFSLLSFLVTGVALGVLALLTLVDNTDTSGVYFSICGVDFS